MSPKKRGTPKRRTSDRATARGAISDAFIDEVCQRLARNQRVRRTLPEGGRLHVDRQLPFLCIHRRAAEGDDTGTERLVTGEPSFLIAPGNPRLRRSVARLVRRIAEQMSAQFGAFLIVEVWAAEEMTLVSPFEGPTPPAAPRGPGGVPRRWKPGFGLATRGPNPPYGTINALLRSLARIRVNRQRAEVEVREHTVGRPPSMPPLLSPADARRMGCRVLGLEVRRIWADAETGEFYPAALRNLRRRLSRALKEAFFVFTRVHTRVRPQHFYSLGRRAMVKAVWEVDRRLAEVADSFDFLLQVTPVNAEAAWREFRRGLFHVPPRFVYRPLSADPVVLKRRLHEIPVERVEDPTLAHLFHQLQDALDRKITLLKDIGTHRFLLGSRALYGGVSSGLLTLAHQLLDAIPHHARDGSHRRSLDAAGFARRAEQEIAQYRAADPRFTAGAAVRDDMFSGLLVSGDTLLIGRQTRIPHARVDALLQHEVGTHLLTYFNGRAQPFRQLHVGLAGYDALQEGLAVLSEYLVGGLSRQRLRLLAARVVAVNRMVQGDTFVDTFRLLHQTYDFPQRVAYTIAMRVYRGGGLTKDVVYLQGLVEVLDYLRAGGELEPLLVGKIAVDHVPLIRELQHREVLRPAPLRPMYLDRPDVRQRLEHVREGVTVPQLIETQAARRERPLR